MNNDVLNVGVIGAGMIGSLHAENLTRRTRRDRGGGHGHR